MGRKPTGRTSRVIRVPLDFDYDIAARLFYDLYPTLVHYYQQSQENPNSPRYEYLKRTIAESDLTDILGAENPFS